MKKELTILETPLTKKEIVESLRRLTAPRGSLWNLLVMRKPFIGKVISDKIKLQTYDTPPIELKIEIEESNQINKILINSELDDSMSRSTKALVYALCFPIAGIFILWQIIENPTSIGVYVWSIVAIIVIVVIAKINEFFTPKPNLSQTLNSIKKHVVKN